MVGRTCYEFAMPLYEFHCKKCGKDSEILVPTTKWAGTKCPKCGSPQLTKKLSVFATSASSGGTDAFPACSGNPSNCGGCCGAGGGSCGL